MTEEMEYPEAVFLIEAYSEDEFKKHLSTLCALNFSDGGFSSHEEDESGGAWTWISTAYADDLPQVLDEVRKFDFIISAKVG